MVSKVYIMDQDYEAVQESPQNQTVMVGGTATFHCRTPLEIRPFIHWVKINQVNMSLEVGTEKDKTRNKIDTYTE